MLFSRRNPPDWRETMRVALWPRRTWGRSVRYIVKRVLRLTATPHSVAAGVAAGVFASFTPFLGFHFLLAFAVAYLIGGNFIAAALGTFVGNPLTFPLIWAGTFWTGKYILADTVGSAGAARIHLDTIQNSSVFELGLDGLADLVRRLWNPVLEPMTVGSIPLGILFGVLFYILTRSLVVRVRLARLRQIEARAKARSSAGRRQELTA